MPETVGLATSSRSVATFARPSAGSALTCEEKHNGSVCSSVCVRASVRVYLSVCTHVVTVKYFAFPFGRFLAPCFIDLLMFYCKRY